jgi:hypothetical protein
LLHRATALRRTRAHRANLIVLQQMDQFPQHTIVTTAGTRLETHEPLTAAFRDVSRKGMNP